MSVFIKKSKLRVKNEDGTSYTGVMNAVAEESTEELIKQIEAKGEEIVAKGKKTLESIPEDYTELNGRVDGLKEDKVSKPSVADDGKIPRAKNGEVEWVEAGQPTDEQTNNAVTSWLNEHPEATTTVQDGSIEEIKINKKFLPWIKKDYVTPEMFGAKCDGVTDDTIALQKAINTKKLVILNAGTYYISGSINVPNNTCIIGSINTNYDFNGGSIIKVEEASNGSCFNIGLTDTRIFSVTFSNFTILSENSDRNNQNKNNTKIAIKCICGTDLILNNICIIGFGGTALYLKDAFDCYYNNCSFILNGSINSPCIYMTGESDNTNAQHFNSCRVEHSPFMIKMDKAVNNEFVNCKFEISYNENEINNDGVIQLLSNLVHGNVFNSCLFVSVSKCYILYTSEDNGNIINSSVFDGGGYYIKMNTSYNNIISNNVFRMCLEKSINIINANGSIISNNNLTLSESNAIWLNANNNNLTNNFYDSVNGVKTMINVYGGSNNIISGYNVDGIINGGYSTIVDKQHIEPKSVNGELANKLTYYMLDASSIITLPVNLLNNTIALICHTIFTGGTIKVADGGVINYGSATGQTSITFSPSNVGIMVCVYNAGNWWLNG